MLSLWLEKKGMATNFFSPLSFVTVFGSGIRDPGSGIRDPGSGIRDPRSGIRDRDPGSGLGKNQDLGSGINILESQHCFKSLPCIFTVPVDFLALEALVTSLQPPVSP